MSTKLIALCGYPGVGKDEIAKYLVEKHGFVRVSFADPMRKALLALDPYVPVEHGSIRSLSSVVNTIGWDEAKRRYYHIRTLLQRMGTEAGRDIHGDDCWVEIAISAIDEAEFGGKSVVVTDLRFANEHAAIVDFVDNLASNNTQLHIVHITRPGYGKVNNHSSEQMDYASIADCTIENSGTVDELHAKVGALLS